MKATSTMKSKSRSDTHFVPDFEEINSSGSSSIELSSPNSRLNSDTKKELVYVKDNVYAWLPAEVISANDLSTKIRIILPEDWTQTTILYDESSVKELEYNMECSSDRKTILSPRSGHNANCRRPEHASGRRIYNYEKKQGDKSNTGGIMRTISLSDYPNGDLPTQNIEKNRRKFSRNVNVRNDNIPPQLMNARDVADLPFLHEAAILYNLKLRNTKMMPYTRVGDIMVAMNPFRWIRGLYSDDNQALYAQYLIWGIKNIKDESSNSIEDWEDNSTMKLSSHSKNGSTQMSSNLIYTDSSNNQQTIKYDSYYSKLGLEPHVFETASLAFSGLSSAQQNQTILVSGESGAGKTETVKLVMTNLATLEQTRPSYTSKVQENRKKKEGAQAIVRRVLESNPLFESFGNAKTIRNNNSSRFGRFTQLQFDVESLAAAARNGRRSVPRCTLAGGVTLTYLLEKSRVVHCAIRERNYHIFYQLLAAPEEEKIAIWDGLKGKTKDSFLYVSSSNTTSIEEKDDKDAWKQTRDALKLFGFDEKNFLDLMQALCIVLQLGNLKFDSPTPSTINEGGSVIVSKEELAKLSTLMGISCENIMKSMTTRTNNIYGEQVVIELNPTDAKDGCDALAKEIYSLLFGILVCQINQCTSPSNMHMHGGMPYYPGSTFGTISLLDIFGFESFSTNRFEQLCINYANERLQQKYVFDNFTTAQEEYASEGIELFDFSIVDNSEVVDLFEGSGKRKLGLIALLGEECIRPNGTDLAFVQKFKKLLNHSLRLLNDELHEPYEFGIKHFAGSVTYDANMFLQRNSDRIPDDLVKCASKSTNNIINKGFSQIFTLKQTNEHGKSMSSKRTVLSKFRSQLGTIIKTIESTRTRYIRCIKPNTNMLPGVTDHYETMRQLVSAGLVTAITISRETFPNKLQYHVVLDRFQCIYDLKMGTPTLQKPQRKTRAITKAEIKADVENMMSFLLVTPFMLADGARVKAYACGKTKVYFRAGALEGLETDRLAFYSVYATVIQTWYMSLVSRIKYIQYKCAIVVLQASSRGRVNRLQYIRLKDSAVKIQARRRGKVARSNYLSIFCAASVCQKMYNRKKLRSKFLNLKYAVVAIQRWTRGNIALKSYRRLQLYTIVAQAHRRGKVASSIFVSMKYKVIRLQSWFRGKILRMKYSRLQVFTLVTQTRRRGKVARSTYLKTKNAVCVLQNTIRLRAALSRYISMKDTFVFIQSWIRGEIYRQRYRKLQRFTILAQTRRRGKVERSRFLEFYFAVIVLQQRFRYMSLRKVVISIQTWTRKEIVSRKYCRLQNFVIFCQRKRRGIVARSRFESMKAATVHVQIWIRGIFSLHKYHRFRYLITRVQSHWKGRSFRLRYLKTRSAVSLIQKATRARSQYISIRDAAIYVQTWTRMKLLQHKYCTLQHFAIFVQRRRRDKVMRSRYLEIQYNATLLQARFRGKMTRSKYNVVQLCSQNDLDVSRGENCKNIRHYTENTDNLTSKTFGRGDSLLGKYILLYNENSNLTNVMNELRDDKENILYHAKALETSGNMTRLHAYRLAEINSSLIREVTYFRHKNAILRNDSWQTKKEKDNELLSVKQNFIEKLSQQDLKLCSLKELERARPRRSANDIVRLNEKLGQQNENYLLKVQSLKGKLHSEISTQCNYFEQLTEALEASHQAREAEIKKLKMLLIQVEQDKNEEIEKLKEEMMCLNDSYSIDAVRSFK